MSAADQLIATILAWAVLRESLRERAQHGNAGRVLHDVGPGEEVVVIMGDRKRTLTNVPFTTGWSQELSTMSAAESGSIAVKSRHSTEA